MSDSDDRWTAIRAAKISVPPHVVHRALAKETVILNIETGRYHGVDQIGARFFDVARAAENLESAAAQLAEDYGQPVERIQADLAAFCDELDRLGLVTIES